MSKFTENIRKIALTEETNLKIKPPVFRDKGPVVSRRGIGLPTPPKAEKFCNVLYSTRDNSYDIAGLLAGTEGPVLNDPCDHIDKLTGLIDFDTAQNTDNFGGEVSLVVHFDGLFE